MLTSFDFYVSVYFDFLCIYLFNGQLDLEVRKL